MGITEADFWLMTFAEIERALASRRRVMEREAIKQAKEKATFDYIHAELVGRSIARCFSKNNTFPTISDAYPTLFDSEEIEEKKKQKEAELFALNLRKFAELHNSKIAGGAND